MMIAYAGAGGVMFVPEDIERSKAKKHPEMLAKKIKRVNDNKCASLEKTTRDLQIEVAE